ncbi:MAG: hypothetical protein IJR89_06330 [Clostridia bacterium]|nr:hypothetical protein [Clostridia bacterium]
MNEQSRKEDQTPYTPPPYRPGQGYSIHLTFGEILSDSLRSRAFRAFAIVQLLFFLLSSFSFRETGGAVSVLPAVDPPCLVFTLAVFLLLSSAKQISDGAMRTGALLFLRIASLFFAVLFALLIPASLLLFFSPGLCGIALPEPFALILKTPLWLVLADLLLLCNALAFFLLFLAARSAARAVLRNARPPLPSSLPLLLLIARFLAAALFLLPPWLSSLGDPASLLSLVFLIRFLLLSGLCLVRFLLFSSFYRRLIRAAETSYFPER